MNTHFKKLISSRHFNTSAYTIIAIVILSVAIYGYRTLNTKLTEVTGRIKNAEDIILAEESIIKELTTSISSVESITSQNAKEAQNKAAELALALKNEQDRRVALEAEQASIRGTTETSLQNLQKNIQAAKAPDLSSLVQSWKPAIARVSCNYRTRTTGEVYATQKGSGTLSAVSGDTATVLTNKHVLLFDTPGTLPSECTVAVANTTFNVTPKNFTLSSSGDEATISIPASAAVKLAAVNFKRCSNDATIGDQMVILGYPAIGSKTDITATEGIISGYDGDYYITSAKVESGNSGGAAILSRNNCYLGIPTFVRKGGIESLARILRQDVIFK